MSNNFIKSQLFISYATEDTNYVSTFVKELSILKDYNVDIFIDYENTYNLIGNNKFDRFRDEIYQSKYFIPFISINYVRKQHTSYECTIALEKYKKSNGDFVIMPISLDSTKSDILPSELIFLNAEKLSIKYMAESIKKMVSSSKINSNVLQKLFENTENLIDNIVNNGYLMITRKTKTINTIEYEINNKDSEKLKRIKVIMTYSKVSIHYGESISNYYNSVITALFLEGQNEFNLVNLINPDVLEDKEYNIEQTSAVIKTSIITLLNQGW